MTAKEVLSVRFAYYIAITNINAICKEAPSYMQVQAFLFADDMVILAEGKEELRRGLGVL